ncbi:hypothetical protein PLICRDRAFT_702325 [Plicaturopsis crispa FD-325 SS-3]|uniref:Uncharacterized protein n=1 Tax=Plicaturopsis crispa FD-325 SS-3 TaxID=944288 RepID=A0A0C9T6P9_PLICR|nr:hypothetical protein PLICRDRAFT_702325 [Plicaturopsis crispa FD-325 SS-3]
MFIGHVRIAHDPAETPWRCRRYRETEKCKKLKERLISPYVDQLPWLEDIVFDSVPDPRMQIMDALRDWRIRQEYYQRKRAQQFGDSEEDDTSEPSTPTQPQANPLPA